MTTLHTPRTLVRENFTSARRRRAISLSMLKVPVNRFTMDLANCIPFWIVAKAMGVCAFDLLSINFVKLYSLLDHRSIIQHFPFC